MTTIVLRLKDGAQAVLVQDGPEYNNLRKFQCIIPPKSEWQTVIATRYNNVGPMSEACGELLDLGEHELWVIVMASPDLAVLL